ncbi:MAG TPA: dipeptide epimerase, partial [Polyangiaceae bacterium]|nr:dipeptide epimerase [Polyangiaceae bacterium]
MRIRNVSFERWNVELTEPFGIATGAQQLAQNVLVEVERDDGGRGLGEAAPFPAVNGETQANALDALREAAPLLAGFDQAHALDLPESVRPLLAAAPSALAAIEMALLDADCRARGVSM